MQLEEVLGCLAKYPLNQYGVVSPEDINFSHDVRGMCEVNSCGSYGKNWQCPPAVGSIEENKEKCLRFKNAVMFNTVGKLEDSFDFEGMSAAGDLHKAVTLEIRDELNAMQGDSLVLGAGGCTICPKCSCIDNSPCRFPDKAISSMEAHGIFVSELSGKSGFKYINGVNTVTYFSLIFF